MIAALIAVAAVTVISGLGTQLSTTFANEGRQGRLPFLLGHPIFQVLQLHGRSRRRRQKKDARMIACAKSGR